MTFLINFRKEIETEEHELEDVENSISKAKDDRQGKLKHYKFVAANEIARCIKVNKIRNN